MLISVRAGLAGWRVAWLAVRPSVERSVVSLSLCFSVCSPVCLYLSACLNETKEMNRFSAYKHHSTQDVFSIFGSDGKTFRQTL